MIMEFIPRSTAINTFGGPEVRTEEIPPRHKVKFHLADLHNVVNRFDIPTPFLENHNSRIVHANPREFPV